MAAEWMVYIDGLELYAYHGVTDAEQAVGHRYRIRIECGFEGPLDPAADDIGQTISYAEVADSAVEFATGNRFRTIEALGWGMARELFRKFGMLDVVSLTIEKALPPIEVVAEAAGIELTCTRADLSPGNKKPR